MLLELIRLSEHPLRSLTILELLDRKTGVTSRGNWDELYKWVWAQDHGAHPEYARFKALLYSRIDPRFGAYFDDHTA